MNFKNYLQLVLFLSLTKKINSSTGNFALEISPDDFPFHVVVNSRFICTGSLITEQHILCPAHCVNGSTWGANIYFGQNADAFFQPHIKENPMEITRSYDIKVHENYKRISRGVYLNNIAIITLPYRVSIRHNIRPVQLISLEEYQFIGEKIVNVTGWYTDTVSNLTLTEVPLLSQDSCKYLYGKDFFVGQQRCVQWPGDENRLNLSGNPVTIDGRILAFVSRSPCLDIGPKCSDHDIFVSVPPFLDWISFQTNTSKEKLTGTMNTNERLNDLRILLQEVKIENTESKERLDRLDFTLAQILLALKSIRTSVENSCLVWNPQ